jgi:hypothetical protein
MPFSHVGRYETVWSSSAALVRVHPLSVARQRMSDSLRMLVVSLEEGREGGIRQARSANHSKDE